MPEVMTVVIIAAIVTTIVMSLFKAMAGAAGAEETDTDLVQSADEALYRIQRDVRQSDPNGIFICTGAGSAAVCTPGSDVSTPTDVQYFAILTARIGGNGPMNWDDSGRPAWTGFDVYWMVPDGNGTNNLAEAFAPALIAPGANPAILNADVINAVATVSASSNYEVVTHSILRIQTMVDVSKDRVAIRIFSQSTSGSHTNTTSVQSDAYARN